MAASDRRGVSGEVEICSKSVTVEQKRIFFNLKQNARGRFLKVRPTAGAGHTHRRVPGGRVKEARKLLGHWLCGEAEPVVARTRQP